MKKLIPAALFICILLTGCQKTPDESAVVSKSGGLNEDIISEPMKSGETRTTDIPEHWRLSEKKNNDRLVIEADLEIEKTDIANLPVKEMNQV